MDRILYIDTVSAFDWLKTAGVMDIKNILDSNFFNQQIANRIDYSIVINQQTLMIKHKIGPTSNYLSTALAFQFSASSFHDTKIGKNFPLIQYLLYSLNT
jgi:hypothetical protein